MIAGVGLRFEYVSNAPSALADQEALAAELDRTHPGTHPGAAASLRKGLPETLTVLRLG